MSFAQVIVSALQKLVVDLAGFIPKLLVAIIIWLVGKYIIHLGVSLLKRVDIKIEAVKKMVETLVFVLEPLGKVILVLVILDYLGIGRSIISALVSGITFAIAIALGIAFGKALEEDARNVVSSVKRELSK